jgi:DNA-binding CsgD family transcriptional regulator
MLEPRLLGRDPELRAIDSFFGRLGEGPALLGFEGHPGIGKTTLLRATVKRAREEGVRVVAAAGAVAESRLSYVALTDLLSEVGPERFAALPEPQLEALDAALLRAHPPARSWSWEAVATAVRSLLSGMLDEGPLVVVIDDIQWIDRSSARVIEFCTRRLGGAFGVVFSRRVGADSWCPEIADRSGAVIRHVTPLDTPAVTRMLRRHVREPLTRRALTRIAEAAGGNPLYALELLRALPPGELSTGPLSLPPSLREMVATRLEGLGEEVEELLLAVAALADPTLEVLSAALGSDVPLLIARAEDLGVLELRGRRVRFSHPLLAEGTMAKAPASRRRAMHRALSEVVTDPEDRARHLALAAVLPDALPALVDAARSARARGAPAAGAELLELALDLGGNNALKVCAAELHLDSGDVQRADVLVREAMDELSAGHDRARAQSLLAELRVRHDSFVEARELLEEAREEADEDSPLQVSIALQLTFVLYSLGLRVEAAECADAALALAEKLAIPGLLAQALGAAATTDFAIGRGVDEGRLRRGLFLEDPEVWSSVALHPAVTASMVLGFTGRLGEAVELLERLRRDYDERGEEHDLAWLGTRLSWFECWRGNLDAAEAHACEASERLLALGTSVGRMLALTAQAQVDAHAGRADSARKGSEEALALAEDTDWKGAMVWQHMTLGFLELSLGDPEAAAVRLAPLAAEAVASGLPEPAADGALVHGDAAEALILVGRVSEAAPLVELLEQRGEALDRTWAIAVGARCRGLLLAAGGDSEGAERSLQRALEAHEELPMPIERGRTLLALGRVQRRQRERRAAKRTLEQSLAIFEDVGSKLWADQARGELAAIGLRAGPPDELTASEERVARLAATGLTNRQIAASLQISPKTVETHLGRVYRKLDIRTRAELGARMGGGRPPG